MTLGAALGASFLVTLVRPATWLLALAAFLLRGGFLVVLAPIVVIPSAVGLANVVTPYLTSFVFGGVSPSILLLAGGIGIAGLAWALGGGLVAAAAEAEMIRTVAEDEDIVATVGVAVAPGDQRGSASLAWRILAVRWVAYLPLIVTIGWGGARIVTAAYRQFTVPSDVTTPLVIRVARDVPEAIALIVLAWLVGGAIGSIAARQVVLGAHRVPSALAIAARRLIRHPIRVGVLEVLPTLALLAVIAPSALASATAWAAVRTSFASGAGPVVTVAFVALLVGLWIGGLVLVGAVSAWRAAAWTVDVAGTFGATDNGRERDWNTAPESATLSDLRPRGVDPDTR